jgi:hypothetical protein
VIKGVPSILSMEVGLTSGDWAMEEIHIQSISILCTNQGTESTSTCSLVFCVISQQTGQIPE